MSDSEEEENQNRTIKITVVGEPATGKSSLCGRYLGVSQLPGGTLGAAVMAGQCLGLRPPVPLELCDVAGNALDTHMLANYLYGSDIVIFVYDLTNLPSFERLSLWMKTVKDILEREARKPLMALFGNKSDLEHQRAVRISTVQNFASEYLLENFKVSARTGEMVNTAFTNLVARVLGVKVWRLLAESNNKTPLCRTPEQNGHIPSLIRTEPTQTLIMNRKALRKFKKSSSILCSLQ